MSHPGNDGNPRLSILFIGLIRCRSAAFKKGENMKVLFAAALVAGPLVGLGSASAAGGCGPGWHRGPYGGCQPNRGVVVVPGAVVVERPVVVAPVRRVCPFGFRWYAGACRPV